MLVVPIVLAVAAYARVLHGEFQFDDDHAIVQNLSIKDLPVMWSGFWPALLDGQRVVTDLTFALNYAQAGLDTWAFHVTNLAIHLAAVLLAFLLARRVLRMAGSPGADGLAVVIAGMFALHPLQTEAVSYVVQRAEAFASAFYMATLVLLLEADRRRMTGRRWVAYAAALTCFVLGLGAKVIVITVPASYLAMMATVPGPDVRDQLATWRTRLLRTSPFLMVGAWWASSTLRGIEHRPDAGFSVPGSDPGSYVLTQVRACATYLRLLIWPAGQSVDWGLPLSRSIAEPAVLLSGAVIFLLALAAAWSFWRWHRDAALGPTVRAAAFGFLWFFVVLSPTSSFVPLADALAEHRVYLASWGIFAALVVIGELLLRRLAVPHRTWVAAGAVALAWCALATATWARNAAWENRVALWTDAVAKAPRFWRPHASLGQAWRIRGDLASAIDEFQTALEIGQSSPGDRVFVLHKLGLVLNDAGRSAEAVPPLREALRLDPGNPDLLAGLAVAALNMRDLQESERLALDALSVAPEHADALNVLGSVRLISGDASAARDLFTRALRSNPDDSRIVFNLGLTYVRLRDRDAACASWWRGIGLPTTRAVHDRMLRDARALGCGWARE